MWLKFNFTFGFLPLLMDDLFNFQSFSSFSHHAADVDERNQNQQRDHVMIGRNDSMFPAEERVQVCPRLSSSSVTSVSDNMLQQNYVSNNLETRGSTSQQQVVLPSLQVPQQEPGTSNIFPPSTTVPNRRFIFTNLYHGDRSNGGFNDPFSSMMSSAQNHTCFSLSQQDTAASEQYARQQEEEEEHTNFNNKHSTNEAANKKQKKKPGRKKKKEGAPKRPMSAYNFFFQQERRQLLESLPQQDDGV